MNWNDNARSHSPTIRVSVTVEQVMFHRDDTGFAIVRTRVDRGPGELLHRDIVLKGTLPRSVRGQTLDAEIQREDSAGWGVQYHVVSAVTRLPDDLDGLGKYLQGVIPNIGPKRSAAICEAFGMQALAILNEPDAVDRLARQAQIAPGWGRRIVAGWQAQTAERAALLTLVGAGLSIPTAHRVVRYFGATIGQTLRESPYRLMEIDGIGFATADGVALRSGMPTDDLRRLRAALLQAVQDSVRSRGHCWIPLGEAKQGASLLTRLAPREFAPLFGPTGLRPMEGLAGEGERIWPAHLLKAEEELSAACVRLLRCPDSVAAQLTEPEWQQVLAATHDASGAPLRLSGEQQLAARTIVEEHPFAILTGGPGTGKSTVLDVIVRALEEAGITNLALCAPTGKAARRMHEVTGREARTIQSLLLREETALERTGSLPISALIVDEASMIDLPLAARLLTAVGPSTRVLLIGDPDQLPSIGPGRVLQDLQDAGVPTCRLTRAFRHAAESGIGQAARTVAGGRCPVLNRVAPQRLAAAETNCVRIEPPTGRELAMLAVYLVTRAIPDQCGVEPEDIRVLVPQYGGECGIAALNAALQEALNPATDGKNEVPWTYPLGGSRKTVQSRLREGDRVLWRTNDAQLQLVNGDELVVEQIIVPEEGGYTITLRCLDEVDTEGRPRRLEMRLEEINAMHAYAISIHKAQGSEYPGTVLVLHDEHRLASRRLLYTGLTRAKKYCVVLSTTAALARAVARCEEDSRRTRLAERIRRLLAAES